MAPKKTHKKKSTTKHKAPPKAVPRKKVLPYRPSKQHKPKKQPTPQPTKQKQPQQRHDAPTGSLKELIKLERQKADTLKPELAQKKQEIAKKKIKVQKSKILRDIIVFVIFLIIIDVYVLFVKQIIPLWLLLVIGLVILIALTAFFFIAHKKKAKEEKKNIGVIKSLVQQKKGAYETDLDVLYNILKERKVLSVTEIAEGFGITKEKAEDWGRILAEHGLLELYYPPVGEAQLKWKEQSTNTE